MNLLNSPLRRAAAIAAGTLLGLGGALVAAGPASAHHSSVEPTSACVTAEGTWQVTWTLHNSERDIVATVVDVDSTPKASKITLKRGDELPKSTEAPLTAQQTEIPAARGGARLGVTVKWVRNGKEVKREQKWGTQKKPTTPCVVTPPTSVPPTAPTSVPPTAPTSVPPTAPTSVPPTLPTDEPSTVPSASPSVEPSGVPSPSGPVTTPQPLPGVPEGYYVSDCDSLTVGVKNPADGETITINLKPSTGEAVTLTVEPGETEEEDFKATGDFTVTATVDGVEGSEVLEYEKPAACAGGGTGAGSGSDLPLTGAAAGSIAGGAAALLAGGAFLFWMARRRKVKFTA